MNEESYPLSENLDFDFLLAIGLIGYVISDSNFENFARSLTHITAVSTKTIKQRVLQQLICVPILLLAAPIPLLAVHLFLHLLNGTAKNSTYSVCNETTTISSNRSIIHNTTVNRNFTTNASSNPTAGDESSISYQHGYVVCISFSLLTATIHFLPVLRMIWSLTSNLEKKTREYFKKHKNNNPGCLTSWEKGMAYLTMLIVFEYAVFMYITMVYFMYMPNLFISREPFDCRDDLDLESENCHKNITKNNNSSSSSNSIPPSDEFYHGMPDYCENPMEWDEPSWFVLIFFILIVNGLDCCWSQQHWTCALMRSGLLTTYCGWIFLASFTKLKQDTTVPQDHPVVLRYVNKMWMAAWIAICVGVLIFVSGWCCKKWPTRKLTPQEQKYGLPDDDGDEMMTTTTADSLSFIIGVSSAFDSNCSNIDETFHDCSGNKSNQGNVVLELSSCQHSKEVGNMSNQSRSCPHSKDVSS